MRRNLENTGVEINAWIEQIYKLARRMDNFEGRLTKAEVSLEALQGDVRLLGEGLSTLNQRLDRYHQDHEIRIRALKAQWFEA